MPSQTQQPQTSATHRGPTHATHGSGQPHPLRGPVSSAERFTPPAPSSSSPATEPLAPARRIDLKAISASLLVELSECQTREAARSSLIRFICQLLNPTSVHLWRVVESGQIAIVDAPESTLPREEMVKLCQPDILTSAQRRSTSITELDRPRNLVALSLPIGRNVSVRQESGQPAEAVEVLTVVLLLGTEPLESFLVILQLLCGYLTFWELDSGSRQLREIALIDQFLLKAVVQMTEAGSAKAAARICVEEIRNALPVGQAAIGVVDSRTGNFRLVALSGAANIDPRTELSQVVRDVLVEAQQRGELLFWQPESATPLESPTARLARLTGASRILSGPLRQIDDTVIGSWVIYGNESLEHQPIARNALVRGERAIARIVTREGNWGRAVAPGGRSTSRWARWWPMLACLAFVGTLLIPAPYRVACNAQVQPQSRRFVAAPFAGVLRNVHAEAGNLVREGDLLAEMDDTELKLEIAELQAEVERLTRSRDVNRAESKEVEAVLDGHKLEQAEARLALLASREQHLQIRSPISGVILSEDLKRAQGLPVRIGQSLFEVAPLDKMRLELRVPADQISQIQTGQTVTVGLVSQSTGAITSKIEQVLPHAETIDGEHVFLAFADLSANSSTLRPGENGTARVEISERPIWWILFHRPWQKLRAKWGWS